MQLAPLINQAAVTKYRQYLKKMGVPTATIDRKLASILGLSEENNVHQNQGNDRQTESNRYVSVDVQNVRLVVFHSLNQNAINKDTIANSKSPVNTAPNQPAAKLTNRSDRIVDQAGLNTINSVYHHLCN